MNKNDSLLSSLERRIKSVKAGSDPKYGKMNAHQMICHCTDFFRMATKEIVSDQKALELGDKVKEMARTGKTVPAPKGLGQVEGEGTKPQDFDTDVGLLIVYLKKFFELPEEFEYAFHPYFGILSKAKWERLALYHTDHHLKQFGY